MRKAGADIFAKSGLEKPANNWKQNQHVLRFFPLFSIGFSPKPVNSGTNGWEPHSSEERPVNERKP